MPYVSGISRWGVLDSRTSSHVQTRRKNMRLLGGAAVASVLISAVPAWCQSAAPAPARDALVGTWRLVSFEDVENGKKVHRYGEKPLGLFIYTPDGHVAIQIANPQKPACAIPAPRDTTKLSYCTPEQALRLLESYAAYWGTYTVDADAGVVVHHVQSDARNTYIGTDQPRPFKLEGDRLVIGDGKTWTRVLERVR
jgi:hypothetical protein